MNALDRFLPHPVKSSCYLAPAGRPAGKRKNDIHRTVFLSRSLGRTAEEINVYALVVVLIVAFYEGDVENCYEVHSWRCGKRRSHQNG